MKTDGFTLIQLMVAVSITCILITVGMPSFAAFKHQQALRQTLSQSYRLLSEARQFAILHKQNTHVVVQTGKNWCLGVSKSPTCDCHSYAGCQIQQKTFQLTSNGNTLDLTDSQEQQALLITFAGGYGTAYGSATTLSFAGEAGTGSVVVNNLGRIRVCTQTTALLGVQTC